MKITIALHWLMTHKNDKCELKKLVIILYKTKLSKDSMM